MSLFEELLGKHHGRAAHGGHQGDHHGHGHQDDHGHGRRFGSNDWGGGFHQAGHDDWGSPHHGDQGRLEGGHARGGSFAHASPLLEQVMRNKTVFVALALLVLVLLVAALAILAYLLPFLGQSLGFVGENGIKGVLGQFAPMLELLRNGSGK